MATIGDQLPQPEAGWSRYDDTDENITYEGTGWSQDFNSNLLWGGSMHHSSSPSARIKFNFTGDRLRIIARTYNDRSNSIQINIDGGDVIETFSEYSSSAMSFVIVYEITSLTFREHYVELQNLATDRLTLDAVDINEIGELLPYREVAMNKSFIYHNGEYKKWSDKWQTISTSLPDEQTFINEGMEVLSDLDRKPAILEQQMNNSGSLGGGKLFKTTIDLKKYLDINNLICRE